MKLTEQVRVNKNKFGKFFWFFFFCILPLISFPFLLDYDLEPKFLFLSAMTMYLLWESRKKRQIPAEGFMIVNILFYTILIFIICTFISSLSAINSCDGRADWIKLVISFLFLYALNRSGLIQINFIFLFIPFTVFLLGIVFIIQLVNYYLSENILAVSTTMGATLGNKNFLSESFVLILPFTISGFLIQKNKIRKLNLAATILILILILTIKTTSAWLSIMLSAFVFIPVYYTTIYKGVNKNKIISGKKLIFRLTIILLLLCIFTFTLNRNHAFDSLKNKFSTTLNYMNTDIANLTATDEEKNTNSVFERLFLWRNSLKLGMENKWTGIGLSNWKIMWPKYGVGGASYLSSGVMHYEHPHNEFLLFFSETGLTGLVLFLLIFILIFIMAARLFLKAENPDNRKIILCMSAGIFSFLILSFFGYPLHRPYSIALLMVIIAVLMNSGERQTVNNKKPILLNGILTAGFLLTLFNFRVAAERMQGEYYMQKALTEQSKGRFPRMLVQLNKAENDFFKLDLTGTPIDWYRGFAHYYSGSDSALFYFKKAESQNPYHIQILSDIGASLVNAGKYDEAIYYLKKAQKIIPHYYQVHFNLAIVYYNQDRPFEALTEINQTYMMGETYDHALRAILKLNAEKMSDSLKTEEEKFRLNNFINNESSLVSINRIAIQNKSSFTKILKDSVELNIEE